MFTPSGSATKRQRIESSRSVADSDGSPLVSRVSVLQPLQVEYFDGNGEPRKRGELDSESIHVETSSMRIASPLPAAISELLAADSNVSTQMDAESDTIWLVSGRRVLVWPNYTASLDYGNVTDSRSRTKCHSLHLPASDTPYRAQLVQVASRATTLCCVAVSPSGLVRFWPNCAFEQQFTEFAIDLRGDELVALGRVIVASSAKGGWKGAGSVSLFVASTLCGNLVQLHVSGSAVQHRVMRDDPGMLRRVLGSFRTLLPAGGGSQAAVVGESVFRLQVVGSRGGKTCVVTSVSRSHLSRWKLQPDVEGGRVRQEGVYGVRELLRTIADAARLGDDGDLQLWDSAGCAADDSVVYLLVTAGSGPRTKVLVARLVLAESRTTAEVKEVLMGEGGVGDPSRLERLSLWVHAEGGARVLGVSVTLRREGGTVGADRLVLVRFVDGGGVFEVLPGCVSVPLASIRDRLLAVRVRTAGGEDGEDSEGRERCGVRVEVLTRRHALVDVLARLPLELEGVVEGDSGVRELGGDSLAQLQQLAATWGSSGVEFDEARRIVMQSVANAASRYDSLDAARLNERITQLATEIRSALKSLPRELVRDALQTLLLERSALSLETLEGGLRKAGTGSAIRASVAIALGKELRGRLRFVLALRSLVRKCIEREDDSDLRELVRRCERAERELLGLVRFVHFHTDRNLPLPLSLARLFAAADQDGTMQSETLFCVAMATYLDSTDAALRAYVREPNEPLDTDEPATDCDTALDCLVELFGDAGRSPRRQGNASSGPGVIRAFVEQESLRNHLYETAQKLFFASRTCRMKKEREAGAAKLEATFIFLVEHFLDALRLPDIPAASTIAHFFLEARRVLLDQVDTVLLTLTAERDRDRERTQLALRLAAQLDDVARCAAHALAQTDPACRTHDAPTVVRELRAIFAARNTSLADRFEQELMQQLEEKLANQQLSEAQTFALVATLVRSPPPSLARLAQRVANQRWLHVLDRNVSSNANLNFNFNNTANVTMNVTADVDVENVANDSETRASLRYLEAFRKLAKFACDENVLLERKRRSVALAKLQLTIARSFSSDATDADQSLEELAACTTSYELYLECMHDALVAMQDMGILVCDGEFETGDGSSERLFPVFSVFELVRGLAQLARVARDAVTLQNANEQRNAPEAASAAAQLVAYENASEAAMLRLKRAVDTLRLFEKAYRFEIRCGFDDELDSADETQQQRASQHSEECRAAIDESWSFIWEQAALAEDWPRLAELASANRDLDTSQLSADNTSVPYRPERDVVRLQLHRRTVFYKLVQVLVVECPQQDIRQLLDTVPTVDSLADSSEPLRELVSHSDLARLVLHNSLDCFLHD